MVNYEAGKWYYSPKYNENCEAFTYIKTTKPTILARVFINDSDKWYETHSGCFEPDEYDEELTPETEKLLKQLKSKIL